MNRTTLATLAAVSTLAAAFFAGSSIARSSATAIAPANIATINMSMVFESLTERKDRLRELQNQADLLKANIQATNAGINRDREAASKLPDGPERDTALDAVVERDVRANIDAKKAENRLEKAQANTIRSIAEKVQKAAAAAAAKNGYTMVLAADDTMSISPRATSNEALQMLNLRRAFYIAPEHDITRQIIDSLNAEYAATKPASPAGGTSAPGN